MSKILQGFIVVLPTPLKADETVDERATRVLVRNVLDNGASGLWVLGSTGESAMLRDSVKRQMVEIVVDETAGRVPVVSGVSDLGTSRVLDHIAQAEKAGVDLVHVLPPFYTPPSQEEARIFFRRLAEESPLPLVIYNIPGVSRIHLDVDVVAELASHERIVGIKDSGGDMRFFQHLSQKVSGNPHFSLLQGSDQLVYLSMKTAGDGVVAGLGTLAPHLFVDIFEALKRGDDDSARENQRQLVALARVVYGCANPVGAIKFLLNRLTLCTPVLAHPYQLPSRTEQSLLIGELQRQQLIRA